MGSTAGHLEGVVLSRQHTRMTLRGQSLPGKEGQAAQMTLDMSFTCPRPRFIPADNMCVCLWAHTHTHLVPSASDMESDHVAGGWRAWRLPDHQP